MPTRHKPKSGWEPSGIVSGKLLSETDFRRMAEALGINEINPDIRGHIQRASVDYHTNLQVDSGAPSTPESKAAIQKLRNEIARVLKKANQSGTQEPLLLEWFRKLDDVSRGHLATVLAQDGALDLMDSEEFTLPEIEQIRTAVENAMVLLSDRQGARGGPRQKKPILRKFIGSLMLAYEELCGKPAGITWHEHRQRYEGRFFDFLKVCLDAVGVKEEEYWSDVALGKQVQLTRKEIKSQGSRTLFSIDQYRWVSTIPPITPPKNRLS